MCELKPLKKQTSYIKSNLKSIFINASQNRNGNTAVLGRKFFAGQPYEQINLRDYQIHQLGQDHASDDQFNQILAKIKTADVVVFGTPIYWSDMSGYMKTFIDRFGQSMGEPGFTNKHSALVITGSEPADAVDPVTHIFKHLTSRMGWSFAGSAISDAQIQQLHDKLFEE
jgi:multimeric flavodoxin WrbA